MALKPFISKINFRMGRNPIIESTGAGSRYIPHPFQAVMLISADFELAWAWRYAKCFETPLQHALETAKRERQNIPAIVNLCEKHNIPITWATVGHLFLDNCEKHDGLAHSSLPRPVHFENDYWKFDGADWFEHDPGTNAQADPEWYCPDLIRMIAASPVDHEIGSHTFSHINCRDEVCSPELMQAELRECKRLAGRYGIELKSFVHPGHTIGNLDVLAAEGFTNFRTDYRNVLGYPRKHDNGLWEFRQTAEFTLRAGWSIDYHIYRYKTIIERAIRSNTVCVLWFHPSFDRAVVEEILPEVFGYVDQNRDKLFVATHSAYINRIMNDHAQ